jgi:hypothetical protein
MLLLDHQVPNLKFIEYFSGDGVMVKQERSRRLHVYIVLAIWQSQKDDSTQSQKDACRGSGSPLPKPPTDRILVILYECHQQPEIDAAVRTILQRTQSEAQ